MSFSVFQIVAVCSSPDTIQNLQRGANDSILCTIYCSYYYTEFFLFKEENVETEVIQIGQQDIRGCIGCGFCYKNGHCVFNDIVDEVNKKLSEIVPKQQQIRNELEEIIRELESD